MTAVTADMVKQLRAGTGAGIMDCKEALSQSQGDFEKAVEFLRKKGVAVAKKRAGRSTSEGAVCAYIHTGEKIGVLLEVNCETDFVAKTDDFREFAKNMAMQIAATNPLGIVPGDVPAETIEKEKAIYRAQALETGKPDKIVEKIADGKLTKFLKENCLLSQPYVRDADKTVEDVLTEIIGKTGERITIRRFVRYQVGEA
ncbi:translation elongation factor Ts [Thermodesulfobacteriota bacterium]